MKTQILKTLFILVICTPFFGAKNIEINKKNNSTSKNSIEIKGNEGKYLFCEVSGFYTIQGRNSYVMYTTNISKLECNPSSYEIENQLKKEFSSITNDWRSSTHRFELFDTYEEAESWKEQRKNAGYKNRYRVIDDGVFAKFYYKCY